MKPLSVKTKIIGVSIIPQLLILLAVVFWINRSFDNSIRMIGQDNIQQSQAAFQQLEQNDIGKLAAALQILMDRRDLQTVFQTGNRDSLYFLVAPLFKDLRNRFQITHWYFIQPDGTCFLRVHNPLAFGDKITRITFEQAVQNQTFGSGKELGKTAFALRVVHPYYDADGNLLGYMELGEEIDHFFEQMHAQTGDELSMLIDKRFLDHDKWKQVRDQKGLEDNWEDMPDLLLVESTSENERLSRFEDGFDQIPDDGTFLAHLELRELHLLRGIFPLYDASDQKVGGVIVLRNETEIYNELLGTTRRTQIFISLIILITLMACFITTRQMLRPIDRAEAVARKVLGGDLTEDISSERSDEIGRLINSMGTMIRNLREVITRVTDFSDLAEQLSITSQLINQGAQQQSDVSTLTSSSMEELSATAEEVATGAQTLSESVSSNLRSILHVADRANEANRSSNSTVEEARTSGEVVTRTINNMIATAEIMSQIVDVISKFEESSQRINSIVDVINDMARQTNLLALNAAIEAARAGEQGRGFAVVANEVRNLAERSANSAQEIATLIGALQDDMHKAIDATHQGSDKVDEGVMLATSAGEALDRIVSSVDQVNQMMQEIRNATQEQAEASESMYQMAEQMSAATAEQKTVGEQIVRSTEKVAHIATANVELSGEITTVTEELRRKAASLRGLISEFRVVVEDEISSDI